MTSLPRVPLGRALGRGRDDAHRVGRAVSWPIRAIGGFLDENRLVRDDDDAERADPAAGSLWRVEHLNRVPAVCRNRGEAGDPSRRTVIADGDVRGRAVEI